MTITTTNKFDYSKVPAVTGVFWLAKLITTGMGESVSDALSSIISKPATLLVSVVAFLILLTMQLRSDRYRPQFYWPTVATLAIAGTALADETHDALGIGYPISVAIYLIAMIATMVVSMGANGFSKKFEVATFWFAYILTRPVGASIADYCGYGTPNLGNEVMSVVWIALFIPVMIYLGVKFHQQLVAEKAA
ncbi:hypothetical protein [Lactiplantibacillus pingfangensis]|uniref:hypothetical protein n=1 Tax=Lactiplantibacillus pingfangensis TaxID=2559915 RepID=UPI0010F89C60|nr:hypothetical protein [Lactiplantibacillus pingfangensis]